MCLPRLCFVGSFSVRSRFVLFVAGVPIETFETRKDAARKRLRGRQRRRDVVGVVVIDVDAIVFKKRVVRVVRLAARARARVRVGFRLELSRRFRKRSEKVSADPLARVVRGSARSAQRLRRERVRLAEAHGVDAAHALRAPKRQRRSAETVSRASFLRFESIARVERKLGRVAEVRVPDGGDHRASALASRDGDRLRVVRGSEPGDTERPQVRVLGEPTPNRAVARARARRWRRRRLPSRPLPEARKKKKRFSNAPSSRRRRARRAV